MESQVLLSPRILRVIEKSKVYDLTFLDFFSKVINMATIRNQWLKISKENYPDWWQAGQVVRVAPYDNGKAFVLMPTNEQRRIPGYSKISIKGYLYSAAFTNGDYKIIPHDGGSIIIYPVKAEDKESGDNDAPDIDESKAELDIDLNNCTTEQMLIWTRAQAVKNIQKGRIPQALVQTLQFAVDITERLEKLTAKPLSKGEESNREALIELIQDASIDAEKRAKLQMMYDKQYNTQGKAQEFKTIVREVKDETTSS